MGLERVRHHLATEQQLGPCIGQEQEKCSSVSAFNKPALCLRQPLEEHKRMHNPQAKRRERKKRNSKQYLFKNKAKKEEKDKQEQVINGDQTVRRQLETQTDLQFCQRQKTSPITRQIDKLDAQLNLTASKRYFKHKNANG